jgi:hypothetical protein
MTLAYPPSVSMSISSLVDAQYMVSWAMGSRSAQRVFPARKDPKFPCNKGKFANENISHYIFMNNYYLPALKKYAYHIHHVRILSKDFCGKERFEAFKKRPGDVNTWRDYAERLSAKVNLGMK